MRHSQVKTMNAYQSPDNVIYFEANGGKPRLSYNGRTAAFSPVTPDTMLLVVDHLVFPDVGKVAEFDVKAKDEAAQKYVASGVFSVEEKTHTNLEGRTLKLSGSRITLDK